jgi:hypothetical protein
MRSGNPYDGTVIVDTTITFYDDSEGEVNDVIKDSGRELGPGEAHEIDWNLVSNDVVPERASGFVRITNVFAALP